VPAEKTARVQERKRIINRRVRSSTRTMEKQAQRLLEQGDVDQAKPAVAQAIINLDRAARKGIIHPNNAARHKSHLAQRLRRGVLFFWGDDSRLLTESASPSRLALKH
jgi:small subunit ribosomal protein S20